MGRIKKYQTPEEKQQAKKQRAHEYYWNNKEKQDERAKQRYRKTKSVKGEKIEILHVDEVREKLEELQSKY